MRLARHLALLLGGWSLLAPGPAARAFDTNAVLAAWLGAQTNVSTWSARFVQTRFIRALHHPLVSTGQVWFARPHHFRWEVGTPAQTLAVRDGDQLQVLYPKLKRAERYPLAGNQSGPIGEALALLDAGFPRNRADFEARFRLLSLHCTNGSWLLDVQPASPSARRMLPSLRLWLDTNTFSLAAQEMTFMDGSRIRNEFTHATLNAAIPPDCFRPALDADYRIVEPPLR